MKLNRRMFLATTTSAAVLAALAACAKNGSGSSGSTAGVPSAAPDELQDGGTLRFGIATAPTNWNAMTVDGNLVDTRLVMKFVMPYTLDWAEDGKATPNPDFLTKLEAEEVGGKTVVTVAVNEKATWGNGRKWDSEDIKASFDHVNDPSYSWASTEGIDKVEKVEIVDKQTAKITFNSVYPDWSAALATLYPKELVADATTFNESMAGATKFNNDYFAGPFKIKSYDESKQIITLERNDKWWGATPKLETVTLHVLDDSALGQAFANKEIDVLDYIFSADVYQQASGRDDAEVRQNTGLQWRHIMFNASSGPLADKAVRQAIVRATNREAIATSDLAGLPVDAKKTLMGNRFFLPVQEGYQDNSTSWGHDVEAAKKLLDGAGWAAGSDGVRAKDGTKLELVMTIPSNAPVATNEANLLQKQLGEVGIKLSVSTVEIDKYFPEYLNKKNYALTAFTTENTQYPLANVGQYYASTSQSNYTGMSVPEVDQYVAKIGSTPDGAERNKLANELDKILWENVFNIPIYQRMQLTAVPKTLRNFGAQGLASFRPESIGYVKS